MPKRRSKPTRSPMKETLKFELFGLIFLFISIIALVQPGAIGRAFHGFFRFFTGSWDFLVPVAMVYLALYLMFKRTWPSWSNRWTGIAIICLATLILSHVRLIEALSGEGRFDNLSAIQTTWNLYLYDMAAAVPVEDLGGGMVGALFFSGLNVLFDSLGTTIVVVFMIIIGLMLFVGLSYLEIWQAIRSVFSRFTGWSKQKATNMKQVMSAGRPSQSPSSQAGSSSIATSHKNAQHILEAEYKEMEAAQMGQKEGIDPQIYDFTDVAYEEQPQSMADSDTNDGHDPKQAGNRSEDVKPVYKKGTEQHQPDKATMSFQVSSKDEESKSSEPMIAYKPSQAHYELPSKHILKASTKKPSAQRQDMKSNARKLEQTLDSFGVSAQVTQVNRGPAVTRYEVHPAVGVKVSRIVNLTDDIALALAAKGIRIEAPIPGKSAIGIEVPNDDVAIVTLREILDSLTFSDSDSKLSIAFGRDISGEPIVAHLNKMPHMLVAGATGSGKSVCINAVITSILFKAKPHEVKFLMIDPKMVELNVYNGIPHLLTPVVTDPKKASMALRKVVSEMERRYELFAQSGTRDIDKYNDLVQQENKVSEGDEEAKKPLLPYIVVVIDELADLMMVAPGDVEDAICRLAQMARAAGIHLIIATQRPSVDVITGVIKSNIPSRIAFGVSSQVDSRTILDIGGAEKLLGKGDMLYLPVGASKPTRIQGVFISDGEVERIVKHCISQQKAQYHAEMDPGEIPDKPAATENQDDLFEDAVQLVIHQGQASVSMLQRRFRIGYTRAARLIDSMEDRGIIGPYEGSKPREVLVSSEEPHIS